ncbi:histone-lysine N-methyltransferase EHMT1 [Caerostris extrusa]|uniref:Histone-lysine N-methyltransferase EHMT1 n=1 Tax=Caerostris extrusa TaxID=172846 RepID=A0AAV4PNZ7_CAEEX|nr:histone-lysine N-methyltransferase EHMT1 [Caerostris extrusa]
MANIFVKTNSQNYQCQSFHWDPKLLIVPCTKAVSQHHLLTPSSNLKHKIFCDIHLWRLKNHHCCPKCGYFCTQGTFLCCKYDQAMKETNENHLFHRRCLLVPDSCFPPGCPHCCMFSDFKNVHLSYVFGNENSQIANRNSDEQDEVLNITDKFQNYHIFMTTQDDQSVNL